MKQWIPTTVTSITPYNVIVDGYPRNTKNLRPRSATDEEAVESRSGQRTSEPQQDQPCGQRGPRSFQSRRRLAPGERRPQQIPEGPHHGKNAISRTLTQRFRRKKRRRMLLPKHRGPVRRRGSPLEADGRPPEPESTPPPEISSVGTTPSHPSPRDTPPDLQPQVPANST